MYRFESIDDYRNAFETAYITGLDKDVFDDFDAVALMTMYKEVVRSLGHIEGILDVLNEFGNYTPEMRDEVAFHTLFIKGIVEATTKKLEKLGLL